MTLAGAWFVVSSLWVYPHSVSYFNESIGGPRHGIEYMETSNVDWGQDVGYLRAWCERHPEARPLYATHEVWVAPLASLGVPTEGPVPRVRSGYEYLETMEPVARIGYGFLVYRIDPREADSD